VEAHSIFHAYWQSSHGCGTYLNLLGCKLEAMSFLHW
jgi:hypothetical protein